MSFKTPDNWEIHIASKDYGPHVHAQWAAEAGALNLQVQKSAPTLAGEVLRFHDVKSAKEADKIGQALALFLGTLEEVVRAGD